MPRITHTHTLADKRRARVRGKIRGTTARPRVTIFRSNKFTYLQVIDDQTRKTVASASTISKTKAKGTKLEQASAAATALAEQLSKISVKAVVLDRGSYKYHGRVRAVAEALRAAKVEV